MWRVLRAEIAYFRPWLLGGLGMAVGVLVLVSVIFHLVGEEGPPSHAADGIRAMFLIMAPLIVAFIAQSYRSEERRARLLLAGAVTPRQIAGAAALLPVVLLSIGVLASGLLLAAGYLATGRLVLETVHPVGFVGGMLFAYTQLGLLAQEATAALGQGRPRAAAGGWAGFALVVVLLAVLYVALARQYVTWGHLLAGHLIVAAAAGAASVELYAGRKDFTR